MDRSCALARRDIAAGWSLGLYGLISVSVFMVVQEAR